MKLIPIVERVAEDGATVRGPAEPMPFTGLPIGDGGDHYIVYELGDDLPQTEHQETA